MKVPVIVPYYWWFCQLGVDWYDDPAYFGAWTMISNPGSLDDIVQRQLWALHHSDCSFSKLKLDCKGMHFWGCFIGLTLALTNIEFGSTGWGEGAGYQQVFLKPFLSMKTQIGTHSLILDQLVLLWVTLQTLIVISRHNHC